MWHCPGPKNPILVRRLGFPARHLTLAVSQTVSQSKSRGLRFNKRSLAPLGDADRTFENFLWSWSCMKFNIGLFWKVTLCIDKLVTARYNNNSNNFLLATFLYSRRIIKYNEYLGQQML